MVKKQRPLSNLSPTLSSTLLSRLWRQWVKAVTLYPITKFGQWGITYTNIAAHQKVISSIVTVVVVVTAAAAVLSPSPSSYSVPGLGIVLFGRKPHVVFLVSNLTI